ncbi:hypothetical protein CGRA01v4_12869 [Colletotrichum graminicola]|nr:hypothetical protein CGRA01v4_12869 [Colletotrichum graminicola]
MGPGPLHHAMQSFVDTNSIFPCAMTSSVQVVGFFQIPGPFPMYDGHVLPAWHAAVCTCPPPQPIDSVGCFHPLAGHAYCMQPSRWCPVPPRLAFPYHWVSCTLYRQHCSKGPTPRRLFLLAMSRCLDGARKPMMFAQADSPRVEPHRLVSIFIACPCVIHWPTPVSRCVSWDLPTSRAPDTAVLVYRPRFQCIPTRQLVHSLHVSVMGTVYNCPA